MEIFIKSAILIDKYSKLNGQNVDIQIEAGHIKKIGQNLEIQKGAKIIEHEDLHVSIGWFDMQSNFYDPGADFIEDLNSGCAAAIAGGFTGVACMPSSLAPIENKSDIEYILNKTKSQLVDVYPIGALTKSMDGKTMTEMYDMSLSGAVAFSDNKNSIQETAVLSRCMLYSKGFNTTVIHYPDDKSLSQNGLMNEGNSSTRMGVKSIPALAEEIMVMRDISLAEFHNTGIHLSGISTAKSVDLIRNAKERGILVSCGVSVNSLVLNDERMLEFDSNLKLKPPLRSESDRNALWEGLKDGTIDCICSDHTPQNIESKECEFDYASFGMIGLETMFALLNAANKNLSLDILLEKISVSPRRILNLNIPKIEIGELANLTLFSTSKKWNYDISEGKSKSKNSFFKNSELSGKALALVHKNQYHLIE